MNIITRQTKQRQIIIKELKKNYSHPTAENLYKIIHKKYPKIGLATIYRNLEFLQKQGEIIKLKTRSKDKKTRYDGDPTKHIHLICKKCGKIMDIMDHKVTITSDQVEKSQFAMDLNSIEIQGLCKNCKN